MSENRPVKFLGLINDNAPLTQYLRRHGVSVEDAPYLLDDSGLDMLWYCLTFYGHRPGELYEKHPCDDYPVHSGPGRTGHPHMGIECVSCGLSYFYCAAHASVYGCYTDRIGNTMPGDIRGNHVMECKGGVDQSERFFEEDRRV